MSASDKKKLRREQESAKLTERQLHEQKEAKKLNLYTTLFVAVLAVLLVVALTVGIVNTVTNSGVRERNTTAVTVGEHNISNAELNYFYVDAVNTFLNNYGSYASLFGLDTTKPLNEQYLDEENGLTWADDFLESAKSTARSVYALYDAAQAAGYTLTEDEQSTIDSTVLNVQMYATLYGYSDADDYMKVMYGKGASVDSYKEYYTKNVIANSYYTAYAEDLTFTDEEISAADAENPKEYTSYSYNYYYIAASKFLEGGTTDENGTVTYSDEEKAASVAAAEAAANELVTEEVDSLDKFDKAIGLLSINADSETTVSSTACDDYLYSSVTSILADWISDEARTEGDKTVIASTSTSTDEDGNEVVTTNGYYVVYFRSSEDNKFPLVNVRHILVSFEGGTYDETTATTTYSDEEKAAAWEAAEELLAQWKAGDATEESFAALATESSDDTGSTATGGLYEDIYPGQMVAAFEDWCYDDHTAGDTGLVETTYGVHIMYYVGESDTTYREYMVTNDLTSHAASEWYDALVEAMTLTDGDTKYISKDLVLSNS